jgi:hypothetical protein
MFRYEVVEWFRDKGLAVALDEFNTRGMAVVHSKDVISGELKLGSILECEKIERDERALRYSAKGIRVI